jgi:hypothetical protein
MIREQIAKELGLEVDDRQVRIFGYGPTPCAGTTIGTATVTLRLGSYKTKIAIHVVPEGLLEEDLLIGQNILYKTDLATIENAGKWWFFPSTDIGSMVDLIQRKVPLRNAEEVVIPPKSLRYCKLVAADGLDETVYVESGQRGPSTYIPQCVTSTNGYLPVANLTEESTTIKVRQVLARGNRAEFQPLEEVSEKVERKPFEMEDLDDLVDPELGALHRGELLALLNKYRDCFAMDLSELGRSRIGEIEIRVDDPSPVVYRPYRLSHSEREFVREHIAELKNYGIIRESNSPYASPILLVKKKTGEVRMCCDFRRLNARTIKDQYPLPWVDDLLDQLVNARKYTSLDLASGYWQIGF